MSFLKATACAAALLLAAPAVSHAQSAEAALELLSRAITFRTVKTGEFGTNQTPQYANFLKEQFIAAGFSADAIEIDAIGDTAAFSATWQGTDPSLKPIAIIGHMDVVEANPADWERDPFTPVIENGYIFGRGSADNKAGISIITATIIKLKQEGWQPKRTIILAFSGDEESGMVTTRHLAQKHKDIELVLNGDGGGGSLDTNHNPTVYSLQGSEKTYADYTLTVTDAGGHSSRPTPGNPIYRLTAGLQRLNAHQFPVKLDDITRGYFTAAAQNAKPEIAAAMRALVANDQDPAAIATLTADGGFTGTIRTTCTTTMIKGGHAANALPQQAQATVNCRILPGVSTDEIQEQLQQIVADPTIKIERLDTGTIAAPSSPLREDVLNAVTKAVHATYPGVQIIPSMSAGATDSMHFRALGIPAYGVGSVFMRREDAFSHGLNERLPLHALPTGLTHWESLIKDMAD